MNHIYFYAQNTTMLSVLVKTHYLGHKVGFQLKKISVICQKKVAWDPQKVTWGPKKGAWLSKKDAGWLSRMFSGIFSEIPRNMPDN